MIANLTPREKEIVRFLCDGRSYKQIAEACGISYHTAKVHIYNIYQKMGVSTKVDLVNLVRFTSFMDSEDKADILV